MFLFKVRKLFLECANAISAVLSLVAVGRRGGHGNLYVLSQTVTAQHDFDKQIHSLAETMD